MGQYIRIHVDFDEFEDEDLAEHLRECGYTVTKIAGDSACVIDEDRLMHISTLALCGQQEAAREIALRIVGEAIGRPL